MELHSDENVLGRGCWHCCLWGLEVGGLGVALVRPPLSYAPRRTAVPHHHAFYTKMIRVLETHVHFLLHRHDDPNLPHGALVAVHEQPSPS